MEESKRAIVCYEEECVERTITEYGCCCAYTMKFQSVLMQLMYFSPVFSPLTRVPAFSNCPLKLRGVDVATVASWLGDSLPACNRVLMRSSGLPMIMPAAPET